RRRRQSADQSRVHSLSRQRKDRDPELRRENLRVPRDREREPAVRTAARVPRRVSLLVAVVILSKTRKWSGRGKAAPWTGRPQTAPAEGKRIQVSESLTKNVSRHSCNCLPWGTVTRRFFAISFTLDGCVNFRLAY